MKALVGVMAVAACAGPSTPVPFDQITPTIAIEWHGPGTSLVVDAQFAGLTVDATMTATFRGTETTFEDFSGSLPLGGMDPIEGETVDIALVNGPQRAVSTVTLPAPFTINSAQPAANGDVDVTWSPTSTDRMGYVPVVIQNSNHMCTVGVRRPLPDIVDTGMATLSREDIFVTGMGCESYTLVMNRFRFGVTAPELAPGTIIATQARDVPM